MSEIPEDPKLRKSKASKEFEAKQGGPSFKASAPKLKKAASAAKSKADVAPKGERKSGGGKAPKPQSKSKAKPSVNSPVVSGTSSKLPVNPTSKPKPESKPDLKPKPLSHIITKATNKIAIQRACWIEPRNETYLSRLATIFDLRKS